MEPSISSTYVFRTAKAALIVPACAIFFHLPFFPSSIALAGPDDPSSGRVMYLSAGGRINTLDPALASDFVSSYVVSALYDRLIEYDYLARPYALIPSMLEAMPEISPDLLHYRFRLRDDLYFNGIPCIFKGCSRDENRVTSADVVFSFLRIADARLRSSGFWLLRGKIKGIDKFFEETSKAAPGDFGPYERGCEGFEIVDDRNFIIHLAKPDPRLLYAIAMPYLSIVPARGAKFHGNDLSENVCGSGAFTMQDWMRDYRIILDRNPGYRRELFAGAEDEADRSRPLPLLDRVVCYLVKQPISGWLLFLQGELDISALDKDNLDAVMMEGQVLSPALKERGIQLIPVPEFQINYVGFSFSDPLLSKNCELRRAMTYAYDVGKRIRHSNFTLIPAQGPIPPGVPGYDPDFRNPYAVHDVEKAKECLAKAGFPGGIDPETGKRLEFTFDLGDTTTYYRQLAELMVDDMRQIGIAIKPVLNNKPRFFQKLNEGQMQIFRLSWVGDYPDAENFLQLFYGPNSGTCNRGFYKDPEFDRMYDEIISMPDCPERTGKYSSMAKYLTSQCPWIFESHPTTYRLIHKWLKNYKPHDFAYCQWKYLSVDPALRGEMKKSFKPLKMSELRGE